MKPREKTTQVRVKRSDWNRLKLLAKADGRKIVWHLNKAVERYLDSQEQMK
jgi:predicted DNA-binding protein